VRQNLAVGDLESSFMEEETDVAYVRHIGKTFPFSGRKAAVQQLGEMVQSHYRWWCKALLAQQTHDWAQLHKPVEVPGFNFIVVGAASGIGKTRFA